MVNGFGEEGLEGAAGFAGFLFDGGNNLAGRQIRRPVKRQFQPNTADEAVGKVGIGSGGERQVMLLCEIFGFFVAGKYRAVQNLNAVKLSQIISQIFLETAKRAERVGDDRQSVLAFDSFQCFAGG